MPLRTRLPSALAIALALAFAAGESSAEAAEPPPGPGGSPGATGAVSSGGSVVMWPTMTPAGDQPSSLPLHAPQESEQGVYARAQELDATLRDAAQDLGYTLHVTDTGPVPGKLRDSDLIHRAAHAGAAGPEAGTWVVSPRLEYTGDNTFIVRIVAVAPKSRELRVRVDTVKGQDVAVRGLVMLRDLLSPAAAAHAAALERERERVDESARARLTPTLRSQGRAVLAVNGALFGAYVAFSVQRASGSDDPRVLYPLLALGTGVGIGSALLVSDEWDIGTGDAWYLAGGAWWGAAAGLLIANGRDVQPFSDRYTWGAGGGLIGLSLATIALTRGKADEGDAMLTVSGGAAGLFLGGLGELAYRGTKPDVTPNYGAGIGSAVGVVGAGVVAALVRVSPSRVMLIDLGLGVGALAAAASASPLLFENVSENKARAFALITGAGTVVGGTLAWFLTRNMARETAGHAPSFARSLSPMGGVIGSSATPTGAVPAYGVGITGRF
ncbi:hypothetical protein [Pendulispora albinea]|uniref:Uncharacterized protein n=1 Tax=Pendulispora albinea TaxID=2741071 RepID=A0ABZ2M105_9BACT